MRLIAAYLRRDLADDLSHRLTFVIELFDALVLLVAVLLFSRGLEGIHASGYDAFGFLFVGLSVNGALGVCLVCFAYSVRGSRAYGMMRMSMILPVPPWKQVLASAAYPMLRGGFDAGLHLAAAAAFGFSLSSANLPAAFVIFVLGLAAASAVGIASAAFAVVFMRGDPLLWLIGAANLVVGGVFIPVDRLPSALQALAWITPVSHALAAMRPVLLDGAPLSAVGGPVAALAVYAAVGIPLGLGLFNAALRHARARGTIKET